MEDLTGRFALLPDGQKVKIESVEASIAVVRRIDGSREGTKAVCEIYNLELTRS